MSERADLHARLLRIQQAAASLAVSHPHLGLSHLVLGVLPHIEQLLYDRDRLDWLEQNVDCAEDESWRQWIDGRRTQRSGRVHSEETNNG